MWVSALAAAGRRAPRISGGGGRVGTAAGKCAQRDINRGLRVKGKVKGKEKGTHFEKFEKICGRGGGGGRQLRLTHSRAGGARHLPVRQNQSCSAQCRSEASCRRCMSGKPEQSRWWLRITHQHVRRLRLHLLDRALD